MSHRYSLALQLLLLVSFLSPSGGMIYSPVACINGILLVHSSIYPSRQTSHNSPLLSINGWRFRVPPSGRRRFPDTPCHVEHQGQVACHQVQFLFEYTKKISHQISSSLASFSLKSLFLSHDSASTSNASSASSEANAIWPLDLPETS